MDLVALPLHGGCFCGAVRYRVSGAPLLVHVCPCHDCQTRSGSVFSLTVLVHTADHRHRTAEDRAADDRTRGHRGR